MPTTAFPPAKRVSAHVLPTDVRDSLPSWFNVYMGVEAGANADNTIAAKTRDLKAFLDFFYRATGFDQADLWTRSITNDFVKKGLDEIEVTRLKAAAEAREALDRYINEVRGQQAGPLFSSRPGRRLALQNVYVALANPTILSLRSLAI